MSNPTLWLVVFAALAIFFLVAAVLSARTWSVSVVILVVALFSAQATFFVYAAAVGRAHTAWQSKAKTYQSDVDVEKAKQERLKNGKLAKEVDDPEFENRADGIRQLKSNIEFALRDRGRVWQGTGKWDAAKGTAEVVITEPNPPNLESQKGEVYVFENKEGGVYLGKFKVTAVEGNKVTLEPTASLSESDKTQLVGKDGAWTIRAAMPVDSHEAFAGYENRQDLEKVLPPKNPRLFANPDVDHPKLVDEYWKDQKTLAMGDIPNERTRVRIRLLKDEEELKLDPIPGTDAERKLKAGDEIVVHKEMADKLINDKSAEEVEKVYDRWLRNYEDLLEHARLRRERLTDVIAQVKTQRQNVETSDAAAKQRVESRKKEKELLAADLAKLKFERDAIKKHNEALAAQFKTAREQLTAKFTEADRLMREFMKLQADAVKRMEEKTAAAR